MMPRSLTAALDVTCPQGALVAGTQVLTLQGARRVEDLRPGERIITRAGMRRLAALTASDAGIGLYHLGFDAPQVIYADGREVPCPAAA